MAAQPVVLYVEDDSQSRIVMQMLLQGRLKLPHVTIFEDSKNFTDRLQVLQPVPDVIFLDIHVKPYTGFQMLDLIRQQPHLQATPVVALTASVMNEDVQLLRTAGFNGCLSKPIDMKIFPDLLRRIVQGEVIWNIV